MSNVANSNTDFSFFSFFRCCTCLVLFNFNIMSIKSMKWCLLCGLIYYNGTLENDMIWRCVCSVMLKIFEHYVIFSNLFIDILLLFNVQKANIYPGILIVSCHFFYIFGLTMLMCAQLICLRWKRWWNETNWC